MPKKAKAVAPAGKRKAKTVKPKAGKTPKTKDVRVPKPKAAKPKKVKTSKSKATKVANTPSGVKEKEQLLSSDVVFEGPLFRVLRDRLIEPGGKENSRDIIRHTGSVVILAVDNTNKKNPWIVVERQYRHAAGQYLWELPAGKLDPEEDPLTGAKRELQEETGYQAKRWKALVEYYPSPGFLGESMKVFLAQGLVAGDAHPEDDEQIEVRLVKLAEIVKMIGKGAILDGKTLTSVLLYARQLAGKRNK